ncbi:MAG: phosphatidate cytidylyltransferase [Oscillospiraceae bacterium]|nr:phosphatidate cytidylyltransferase [Oscillospiraceae bacterium]
MKSRLLVAAIGVPLILWVVLWAPMEVFTAFLAALSAIAAWELMKCVGAQKHRALCTIAVLGAVFSVGFSFIKVYIYGELVVAYAMLVFSYAVFKGGEVKFQQIMAALFAMFIIPYAFTSFLRLGGPRGFQRPFLLLPLLFSFGSDTFAFFAGLTLGRHKLAPRVSPKKTVEGALGGLVGNALCGVVFALVMNLGFQYDISYPGIAVLGAGCSVAAQLGDLSFSLIKREFGIKDYGRIFLAHGGVLDRFDSVLFVAPVLGILMPLLGMR